MFVISKLNENLIKPLITNHIVPNRKISCIADIALIKNNHRYIIYGWNSRASDGFD